MNFLSTISILAVVAPCLGWAQDIRFETGITNVHVDALAKQAGLTLRGLTKNDFVIRDDGKAQPLLAFEEETVPLDLIVMLDTTPGLQYPNMKEHRSQITAAAIAALSKMRAQDRTAVLSFAGPRVEQEFISDQTAVAAALERAAHSVPMSMVRSLPLQWAAWLLAADAKTARANSVSERKRAILMVTKDDSRGWSPDELVIQQLWSMNVALHVLIVPADRTRQQIFGPRLDNSAHIAKATGGDVVVDEKGTLEKSLPDLLARIRSTYSMWYRVPESKSGELRHITVELNDEAKKKYPNAEIKAREGYIAP
jgi:Ca-activated chloride channel homolog